MRYFKHIFIFLFVLASCSTEIDSDLETAIKNGNISDSSSDLGGTIFTGENSTTTTEYLYNFEDGEVPGIFSMSGNANWDISASTYASGAYSLKSGSIVHSQTSCVSLTQTTIAGPLVFYYRTSSESSDNLKFYLDGSINKTASGTTSSNWTRYSATVSSSGSHTFKWCYEKDSSSSSGSDAVWIDEILMPLEVKTISSASTGHSFSCATDNSSAVTCWGYGSHGQLGNGSTTYQSTPVSVSGISTATSISSGHYTSCAVLSGGTIKCWGEGGSGQLGNGSTSDQSTPVSVSGISNATSVSTGYRHTCAVLSSGFVKCWGEGGSGQLGEMSYYDRSTPVTVSDLGNVTSVSAGYDHTCAVLSSGSVKCWGNAGYGRLGNGHTYPNKLNPVSVSGISTATSVSSGLYHNCALLSGGTVKCWGYGYYGQLGNGSTNTQTTPVSVSGISTATSVSMGSSSSDHTCAVLSGGTVKCWGRGGNGRLGNGSTDNWATPVSVSDISTATSVSAGYNHTCAVLSGGTVKCWGDNGYGQLGNGNTTDQTEPVTVMNYTDGDAPTGSISINNKSSYSSGYKTVSLTLTAADSTAVAAYYLSTSSSTPSTTSSSWTYVTQATSLSLSVSKSRYFSSGNNYYYVWYKDVLGNISEGYSDSVYCSTSSCY